MSALAGAHSPRPDWLDALLERLAAPLADGRTRRGDKSRALALAWAREQVRLAVADVLVAAVAAGQVRADVERDVLAWLVLAAADALAYEPPEAVPDRLKALREFLRPR